MRRTDLPIMASCTSCGKCCGPVAASREEVKRIKAHLADTGEKWVPPQGDDAFRCGFLRDNGDGTFGCAVYEARPWTCRAFGVIKQLPCSFFPEEAVVDYSADKTRLTGVVPEKARLLGEHFESGYLLRLEAAIAGRVQSPST